jgi:hypothetical protein
LAFDLLIAAGSDVNDPSIKMPKTIRENKIQVVNLNHQEIRQAINETAENR